ncbi:MAG TPA: hypothetical protein VGX68_11340 [Thermoanaerobaculia bacterium]|jgi:hypothetical protein|nr:hypothetical protein [Thermoanaerobaculia bacterium]
MRTLPVKVLILLILTLMAAQAHGLPSSSPQTTASQSLQSEAVAAPADPSPTPVDVSDAPELSEFRIYFLHLANLDAAADKADAEGTPGDTDGWRSFEQNRAGLTETEGALLKDVAYRCNQALEADLEGTEPMATVSAAVDELRTLLGPTAFDAVSRRILDLIRPAVTTVPTAEGTEEDEIPVEPQAVGPSVAIFSLILKLQDGTFMAECGTSPNDADTINRYAGGVTISCQVYGGGLTTPLNVLCGSSPRATTCTETYAAAPPNRSRLVQATHGLRMKNANPCLGQSPPFAGFEDPLFFCRTGKLPPHYFEMGDVPPREGGSPTCWDPEAVPDVCVIATSVSGQIAYIDISPHEATAHAGGTVKFSSFMQATWSIDGPGTIDNNTGLSTVYTAPASVSSQQTVTIKACDAYAPGDCVTGTVTLQPDNVEVRVDLTPSRDEVLPGENREFTATVTGASGLTVLWTLESPTFGASINPITADGSKAKFVAPPKDQIDATQEIIVRACVKPQSTEICSTAKVRVPKIYIDLLADPATHSLNPGGTIQFNALVSGSNVARELRWESYPELADAFFTVETPDTVATYKASFLDRTTVTIRACLKRTVEDFCSELYSLQIVDPFFVNPGSATVGAGQTQQFTAPNTEVNWSIEPATPEAGSINQSGLYTAPATLGSVTTVTIIATSQADDTRKSTATVTLTKAPVTFTCTPSPTEATFGNAVTWTATVTGLVPASTQYALFRKKAGDPEWTPPVSTPAWQSSSTLSWTPAADQLGTWEISIWVKDGNTPANENGYGYAASCNPGPVQVVGHPTVTSTPSPANAYHGTTLKWMATGSGGVPGTLQYALFRKKTGDADWTPSINSPSWQTGNELSWTPGTNDIGTWEIIIWVKDANTPASMNGYGFAGYTNPGPVQVVAPPTVTSTPSPTYANHGSAITWTATGSGGVPGTLQYALFRRKVGTGPDWTPPVTAPAWQSGNVLSWTPSSSENGTWEIVIWVKDSITPPDMNGYGFAGYTNAGPVQVVTPLAITCSVSPSSGAPGTGFTVIATPSGGAGTIQYAFFRRRSGATNWTPDVTAPAWQTNNSSTWTPAAADAGTWQFYIWAKDATTKPGTNTYGYSAGCNPGGVDVLSPLSVSGTASPSWVNYGTTLTWTVTASGGTPASTQYALLRRRSGTTAAWTPSETSPVWQTSNVLSWTPTSADVGAWELSIWVKDGNTPSTMNTYGYAASYNPGSVQVVAPLALTSTPSPAASYYGNTITWTLTATGGVPATTQYAWGKRRVGTTDWNPPAPVWQSSNVVTWTPTSADAGTWEFGFVVRDGNTPPTMNGAGYAAYYNPGNTQVVAPMTLTVTGSPASRPHDGTAITWTATASGGTSVNRQYAFFRRRAGATAWTPAVTAPSWQASNSFTWDPGPADVGTWEIYVWAKDSATPANMNTYGYAAGYNPGPATVTAPMCLSSTASPAMVNPGTTITWNATACGGYPPTTEFALFRRRVGATAWIPDVTAPAWQASNVLTWTPTSADVGTWEIVLWVRDDDTPPSPGYGATFNPGNVQVVAPLTVTGTGSPAAVYHGNPVTWTATGSGGTGAGRQYAFFRRKVGTSSWIPDVTSPAWQTSNVLSWTPAAGDVGTWETSIWFKDANTPANANTYGYGAYYNPGPVQVFAPPTVTGTGSPSSVNYGTTITWTATASGGTGSPRQYAFFRRKVGTSNWIPAVTSPAWQTSNVMSWTPAAGDVGTWETSIWLKDGDTPATMNGYGFAAYYNPGPLEVVGPLSVTCSGSPASAQYGTALTWTAYASGGYAPTIQYAFFRRRAGASSWTPAVTSPAWQSSNVMNWTSSAGDVGTWETYIWVRDANTPANMNTYGYAAGCNPGPVQITAPLSLTGTGSPGPTPYGNTITWTAYASGGYPPTTKYALFRRLAGTSSWTPAVTSPAWQSSNVLSWTPTAGDVGTWDIIIWVKDGNTPANMNTYGYAAYYNAGPVEITEPVYQYYAPSGWIDGFDSLHVWGWACDPDYPWESNRVDFWTTGWQFLGSADANGGSSSGIYNACGGGWAHYFDFYHWGGILPGTHFMGWSIDLPYSTPGNDNRPIGGFGSTGNGTEFVMP